jgi:hypothetical protein
MLLSKKDGIGCDTCGRSYRTQFTYYSYESERVEVDAKKMKTATREKDLDLDVCEKCYENMHNKVKDNLAPKEIKDTIKCDFCPNLMKNNFIYHRILIHKVTVDKEQEKDGPASVDMKHFDLRLDDNCFKGLITLAMETRQSAKQKGEWS